MSAMLSEVQGARGARNGSIRTLYPKLIDIPTLQLTVLSPGGLRVGQVWLRSELFVDSCLRGREVLGELLVRLGGLGFQALDDLRRARRSVTGACMHGQSHKETCDKDQRSS